ncbi:MAG: mechanosensitive ion channel domain-containing protein [Anaerolineaceae bacterium]
MPLFLFDYTSWQEWRGWLDNHGVRLLVIVVLLVATAFVFRRVVSGVLSRAIARAARVRKEDSAAIRRRADALSATLNWAFGVVLGFLGLGLLLGELGLNVSALIAGVGVAGIALGLGAQTLVKDVLNGIFILIEDQYAVGDHVTVAGATGEVIEINPRRTVIRDDAGNVHIIPNSVITVAVNRTAGLDRFRVSFDVPFRESETAAVVAAQVAKELATEHAAWLQTSPRVASQVAVGEGEVRLTVVGDARSANRWQVEADLRRRLTGAFDAARIEMKFDSGEQPKPA